jgi:hypothetical protein
MRTASPAIVARAIMRTVALLTPVAPSACCDVPQAVIQRARCCCAAVPVTRSSVAAHAMIDAIATRVIAFFQWPQCSRFVVVGA